VVAAQSCSRNDVQRGNGVACASRGPKGFKTTLILLRSRAQEVGGEGCVHEVGLGGEFVSCVWWTTRRSEGSCAVCSSHAVAVSNNAGETFQLRCTKLEGHGRKW
jgi:hypothetical protein